MVRISSWNMILISNDFGHKRKIYNFEPFNVLLSISTNIAAAYDCVCAPGSLMEILNWKIRYKYSITISLNCIFVAIANNTLYGSKLYIFLL